MLPVPLERKNTHLWEPGGISATGVGRRLGENLGPDNSVVLAYDTFSKAQSET